MTTRCGRFISLEGIEGAGKSTQCAVIRACLLDAGLEVTTTREPGGSEIAERVRGLLLDRANQGMHPDAELLLLFAARAEHLHKTILPALAAGRWVLCDRFTDATYAYQGGGRGLNPADIAWLESFIQGSLRPDLTILLDLAPAAGLARASGRSAPDRFESETLHFFERVRSAYLRIARREPRRMRVIDAERDPEAVAGDVRRVMRALIASTDEA